MTALIQQVNLFLSTHVCPNTKSSYGRALTLYTEWLCSQNVNNPQIDLGTACDYRDHVIEQFAPSTAALHLAAVKSFYKTLKAVGIIQINVWEVVRIPAPKQTVHKTKAVSSERLDRIFWLAERNPTHRLAFRLLYEAALRRAEVVSLPKSALIETRQGWALDVTGKGEKTAMVGISDDLAADIREQAARVQGEYLFPGRNGHITTRQLNNITAAYGTGCHALRHTHATEALESGIPIQDVSRTLRHSGLATTMRYFDAINQVALSSARKVGNGRFIQSREEGTNREDAV